MWHKCNKKHNKVTRDPKTEYKIFFESKKRGGS